MDKCNYTRNHRLGKFHNTPCHIKLPSHKGLKLYAQLSVKTSRAYADEHKIMLTSPKRSHVKDLECITDGGRSLPVIELEIDAVDKEGRRVCNIYLDRVNNKGRTFEVTLIRVDVKFRSHQIVPLLYKHLMKKLDIQLKAGTPQSPGGVKLWYNLSQLPDIMVYGRRGKGRRFTILEPDHIDEEVVMPSGTPIYENYVATTDFNMFATVIGRRC